MTHLGHRVSPFLSFILIIIILCVMFSRVFFVCYSKNYWIDFQSDFSYHIRTSARMSDTIFVTLTLCNDLDLGKVPPTHFGSYLKNHWEDHHQILTQDRWHSGLSDKLKKSRAVFMYDVRGTFFYRAYVAEMVFLQYFCSGLME